ncbi:MAG: NusG domain II-containing protein [Clostridia bacterium]|nr:NusG domain II-containing protein [Clostridia bacterium]
MDKKLFRKADMIIILAVLLIAGVFLLWQYSSGDNLRAVITVDGKIVETLDLDKVTGKKVIVPDTSPKVKIVAEKGSIRFDEAECRDKLCVSRGKLYRKGDTAVCLPSKTVITITGGSVDAMTY